MLILPVASILIARGMYPDTPLLPLVGLWFVVWGVGVRLGLAGLRQLLKPEATAQGIFRLSGGGVLVLVRELGTANLAIGIVGLMALAIPTFVLPAAIYAAIFYAAAGILHLRHADRAVNESIAMVSDLWMALILAVFAGLSLMNL